MTRIMRSEPRTTARTTTARVLLTALLATQTACASTGRLKEYDFRDRSVAVVAIVPPRPYVETGYGPELAGRGVLGALVAVGSSVYKEVQASKLRARLDSASAGMDLSDRIAGGVLERSARYLGARAVETSRDADFQIEVHVDEYGIDARDWDNGARFHIEARLLMLDREGREVWKGKVSENEELTSSWFSPGAAASDVWTGSALGDLTVREAEEAFNAIADHTADRLAEKLRKAMEKVRGG